MVALIWRHEFKSVFSLISLIFSLIIIQPVSIFCSNSEVWAVFAVLSVFKQEKTEVEGVSARVKPLASDKHNVSIAKGSPAVTTLSAVSHPPHSQK